MEHHESLARIYWSNHTINITYPYFTKKNTFKSAQLDPWDLEYVQVSCKLCAHILYLNYHEDELAPVTGPTTALNNNYYVTYYNA